MKGRIIFYNKAGGGWDGIEAVVKLDQRRFLDGK